MKPAGTKTDILVVAKRLVFIQILAFLAAIIFIGIWSTFLGSRWRGIATGLTMWFLLFLAYCESWNQGFYDIGRIKRGEIKRSLLRGVFPALLAVIPGAVFAGFMIIMQAAGGSGYIILDQDISFYLYRIWHMPFFGLFSWMEGAPIRYFLPLITLPVVCGVAYPLGLIEYSLSKTLIYERDKDKTKRNG